jgi:hypothetical protein
MIETSNVLFTQAQLTQFLEEQSPGAYTGNARSLFTVDNSVQPWAESYQTAIRSLPGLEAEIIGYQSVLPNVMRLSRKTVTAPVVALGDSVVYTVQDVAVAQTFNTNLDRLALDAIQEGIYRKEDRLVFRGDNNSGVFGIGNHPMIMQVALPANGSDNGFVNTTSWMGKSSGAIIKEFGELLRIQDEASEAMGAPAVDTLILPTTVATYLATTFVNPANPNTSILDLFRNSFPQISIASSVLMNSLPLGSLNGASETAALLYNRTSALSVVIPRDVTLEPTQASDLKLSTPAHSRFGGVRVFYPESVALLVGI